MNNTQTTRCRLCGDLKPRIQLVHLRADEVETLKIVQKLSRLSLEVSHLNSSTDPLPKTVCLPCNDSLDRAYEFVSRVEAAQAKLIQIASPRNVKQEVLDDENTDESIQQKYDPSNVKLEFEMVKCEPDLTSECEFMATGIKTQKKKRESCLDMPTVSQSCLSWKDYSWQCAYCDNSFPNIDELKSHSMKLHECCNAYQCMDCKARNYNLDRFLSHVNSHRKYLKLSCYKCHKMFSKTTEANVHKSFHSDSDLKCSGCNDTFSSIEELTKHSDAFNKFFKNPATPSLLRLADNLTCVQCHKTFKTEKYLKRHLMIHSERKRVHTCDKCGKCFLTKKDLGGHMDMHEDLRPYQCEVCNDRFRRRAHLLRHISIHDEEKPFCCEQCGRQFRLQSHLNAHSVLHSDSLPYVCSYCRKGFRHKKVLITHIRQHTGEKPYSCEDCQREFTNWPNYNKHMKTRHGIDKAKKRLIKIIKNNK